METLIKLKIRKDYVRKSDGYGQVYMYVRIDKEKHLVELGLHWPPNLLDETSNSLLPRQKPDKICSDYNLIIRQAFSNANDILIECRLANRSMTMKEFLAEYHDYEKRKDFIVYMEKKIEERYKRKKISLGTKKSHINTLNWLKLFSPKLPYLQLTKKKIEDFEFFLQRQANRRSGTGQKLDSNTIANVLKYTRAYINLAIKEKVPIENPFKGADVKTNQDGKEIDFLLPEQVAELIKLYKDSTMPIGERLTLCRYLIACFLSLRISDIMKLTPKQVEEYEQTKRLVFQPTKQQMTLKRKTVFIPIDDVALRYLKDCVQLQQECERAGMKISEPYGRKVLKKISKRLNIDMKGFHTGRHTFATNYLRAGGKVYNLQHIMGHSNINTTMGYVHVIQSDTDDEMLQLSNFYQNYL